MDKVYREYKRRLTQTQTQLDGDLAKLSPTDTSPTHGVGVARKEMDLSHEEKQFLLAVERGDMATARRFLDATVHCEASERPNINCVDPLGRSALLLSIEYENIEMTELLLSYDVEIGEAVLHAIQEGSVEAVEMLLQHQEAMARKSPSSLPSAPHPASSKSASGSFTSDITPIILAAHKDNYEIIKLLLERGESVPRPHDVRCNCTECVVYLHEDSLNHSKSRLNAYRALASPSLISLSSKDPILTAFELSAELKRLSHIENEFKTDYEALAELCQEYAGALLGETRTSNELEIILNHEPVESADSSIAGHISGSNSFKADDGEKMTLARLKLAVKYKQKQFVSHPHCQQLLGSLWYEGLPGFRRRHFILKATIISTIGVMFPVMCIMYLLAPKSWLGKVIRKPFIKFICHSASYIIFLALLILASQRIESVIRVDSGDDTHTDVTKSEKRGPPPTSIEWMILAWVIGFVWAEMKQLWDEGWEEYVTDWWNLVDWVTNCMYVATVSLRVVAYMIVKREESEGKMTAYAFRRDWDPWEPTLIAEGVFATANIFSSLKLIYIFTINPHLGPMQISLGRIVFDIMKFLILVLLVIFAFACGLNQLYWYYASMKENECRTNINQEAFDVCIMRYKNFANLFETLQTLFWGVFGLVDLEKFQIHKEHVFTMFVGLTMFGVYCSITIVVLINLLIAMMSNSYQIIADKADLEWKFARAKLWLSYFEEGATLPSPFNIIPSPKSICYIFISIYHKICACDKRQKRNRWQSVRKLVRRISEREAKYQSVMRDLVKRYIMRKEQQGQNEGVTEDDLNEIKQDISAFRYELLEILQDSGFKVKTLSKSSGLKKKKKRMTLEKSMSKKLFDMDTIPDSGEEMSPPAEQFLDLQNEKTSVSKFSLFKAVLKKQGSDSSGKSITSSWWPSRHSSPSDHGAKATGSSQREPIHSDPSLDSDEVALNPVKLEPVARSSATKRVSFFHQPLQSNESNESSLEGFEFEPRASSAKERKIEYL